MAAQIFISSEYLIFQLLLAYKIGYTSMIKFKIKKMIFSTSFNQNKANFQAFVLFTKVTFLKNCSFCVLIPFVDLFQFWVWVHQFDQLKIRFHEWQYEVVF